MGTTCPVTSSTTRWNFTHAQKNSSSDPAIPCWNLGGSAHCGAS